MPRRACRCCFREQPRRNVDRRAAMPVREVAPARHLYILDLRPRTKTTIRARPREDEACASGDHGDRSKRDIEYRFSATFPRRLFYQSSMDQERFQKNLLLTAAEEYRDLETGKVISQFVAYEPHRVMGVNLQLEMHKIGETGETHVLWRGVK